MRRALTVALMVFGLMTQASAWGPRGHELVAYIAYMQLDAAMQAMVDTLVEQNPCIDQWTTQVAGLPTQQQHAALFMLAATWPDMIKPLNGKIVYTCPHAPAFISTDGGKGANGRFSADIPPTDTQQDIDAATTNQGYADVRRHQYWHFIDTPISGDGTPTTPALEPNVLTELVLLTHDLAANTMTLAQRSYDLVWVEHLTGDIHQPLHDAQRFTKGLPNGDEGGNSVPICLTAAKCPHELHQFWDDLPGSAGSLSATIALGDKLNAHDAPTTPTIDIDNPANWAAATWALAQKDAYAAPFTPTAKVVPPSAVGATTDYHQVAILDMQHQILLAGYRLAGLLKSSLANWSGN